MDRPGVGDITSDKRGTGARWNSGKAPLHMVPLVLIRGIAEVLHMVTTRKVKPYRAWNWMKGMDWSVCYDCAMRHMDDWWCGEDLDPETGKHHLYHAAANILMLIWYAALGNYPEGDDRPPTRKYARQPGRQDVSEQLFADINGAVGKGTSEVDPFALEVDLEPGEIMAEVWFPPVNSLSSVLAKEWHEGGGSLSDVTPEEWDRAAHECGWGRPAPKKPKLEVVRRRGSEADDE